MSHTHPHHQTNHRRHGGDSQGVFGTEKDRVNCPFFWKIGACRHGERCSRLHTKPKESQTLLFSNLYHQPKDVFAEASEDFRLFVEFYTDIYCELGKYGTIEEMHVCENLADHLLGNVFCKFSTIDEARAALQAVKGRSYGGRAVAVEHSNVVDFHEATCRQHEMGACTRGGYCNFMHVHAVPTELVEFCSTIAQTLRVARSRQLQAASDATTLKHDAGDDEHASGLFGGFSPLFAPAFAPPGLALSNGAPAPYAPAIVPAAPPRRAPFLRGSTLIAPSSPFSPLTQTVLATVAAVAQEHCLAVSAPVHVSIVANEATGSGVALLITFQPEDPFAGTEFSEELENLYAMYSRKGFLTPQEYLRRKTEIVRRKLEELVAPLAEENWVEAERQLIAWQQSVAFRKHSSMASGQRRRGTAADALEDSGSGSLLDVIAGSPVDDASVSKPEPSQLSRWDKGAAAGSATRVPNVVAETSDRLFIGGIPSQLGEADVLAMLTQIGAVKSFRLMKDDVGHSKGYAFFEFVDPACIERACETLSGKQVYDKVLLVQRANSIAYTDRLPRKSRKVAVPQTNSNFNYVGLIIGPRGTMQKAIEQESGARIAVRGRGANKQRRGGAGGSGGAAGGSRAGADAAGADEDLHVLVTADSDAQLDHATRMLEQLLTQLPGDDTPSYASAVAGGPMQPGAAAAPAFAPARGRANSHGTKGNSAAQTNGSSGSAGNGRSREIEDPCRLHVGGLPLGLTRDDVHMLFQPFGDIDSIELVMPDNKPLGYAFVQFATPDAALMAKRNMVDFPLAGNVLKVDYATRRQSRR